jgi:hypothetical protein
MCLCALSDASSSGSGVRLSLLLRRVPLPSRQAHPAAPSLFLSRFLPRASNPVCASANGSDARSQSTYTAKWFKGAELATAFGIVLSFSRLGSAVNFDVSPAILSAVCTPLPRTLAHECRILLILGVTPYAEDIRLMRRDFTVARRFESCPWIRSRDVGGDLYLHRVVAVLPASKCHGQSRGKHEGAPMLAHVCLPATARGLVFVCVLDSTVSIE